MTFFLAVLASFLNLLSVTELSVFPFSSSLIQSQGKARNFFLLKARTLKHQNNPASKTVRKRPTVKSRHCSWQHWAPRPHLGFSLLSRHFPWFFFLFSDSLFNFCISHPSTTSIFFHFQLPGTEYLFLYNYPFPTATSAFCQPSLSILCLYFHGLINGLAWRTIGCRAACVILWTFVFRMGGVGCHVSSLHVWVPVQVFAQQAAEAQEQKVPCESGWRSWAWTLYGRTLVCVECV